MVKNSISLLDCTLRDGGYVNNWCFGEQAICNIIEELVEAGTDIVECGILGKVDNPRTQSKFEKISDIKYFIQNKQKNIIYSCLLNFSEKDMFEIDKVDNDGVNAIRLAFFKPDYKNAILYAKELIDKGYKVFLQAMATSYYTNEDIVTMIQLVNKLQPYALYIVDSFGTMTCKDIKFFYEVFNNMLDNNIVLGFHAHNNKQLAFANSSYFCDLAVDRKIAVDSSIFGMGRGAGNAPTELLASYINDTGYGKYDVNCYINIFEKYIKKIFSQLYWGYTMSYAISSLENINPAYIWYLSTLGINEEHIIRDIIHDIPLSCRYFLNKTVLHSILNKRGFF